MASPSPCVLAAALSGIKRAEIPGKERWALQKYAVQLFMLGPLQPQETPSPDPDVGTGSFGESAILDLDMVYGALSRAAGTSIARPTAAVAFLRTAGLNDFVKRFSGLTSRRHRAAHPDTAFLNDLENALADLDPDILASHAHDFRDGGSMASNVDGLVGT